MPKKTGRRKGGLRSFVERVNSDPLARMRFLVDPIQAVNEAGIDLSEASKVELRSLVKEYVERFPNIALLPTGLSRKSRERAPFAAKAGIETEDETIFII